MHPSPHMPPIDAVECLKQTCIPPGPGLDKLKSEKDQEHQRPVDLLPERSADAVAAWLQAHPGVEIITRDRASVYKEGATRGAPDARQVVDRFHLLKSATRWPWNW